MEAQRKRPYHYHKKRLKQAEESFVIDGNTKTFEPPVYNPLLDKHLQLFFAKSDRVDLLKHNKLINRRYEVVETAKRPSESTRHRKSMSFDRSYSMAEGKSVGLRPNLKLGERPIKHILVGYETIYNRRYSKRDQPLSREILNKYIQTQKDKIRSQSFNENSN